MRIASKLSVIPEGVIFVEKSQDAKLSRGKKVSVTLAAQDSCPQACPFLPSEEDRRTGKMGACYGNNGNMNTHSYRLNSTGPHDPEKLAQREAALIRAATGKRPLRLHTVGDAKTVKAVEAIAQASEEYTGKHNQPVWTYTHVHHVPRRAWRNVSVLRSCHNVRQVKRAFLAGYASALTVDAFPTGAKKWVDEGITYQPCPNQTAGYRIKGDRSSGPKVTCAECRLCWDDQKLLEDRKVIVFALHGDGIRQPGQKDRFDRKEEEFDLLALARK